MVQLFCHIILIFFIQKYKNLMKQISILSFFNLLKKRIRINNSHTKGLFLNLTLCIYIKNNNDYLILQQKNTAIYICMYMV